jgi:hypothetical protein
MSRVFYRTLISQADIHLNEIPTLLHRTRVNFLTDKSLDSAIQELRKALELLEAAKVSYCSSSLSSLDSSPSAIPLK